MEPKPVVMTQVKWSYGYRSTKLFAAPPSPPLNLCIGQDVYHEILELLQNQQAKCYEIGTWLKFTRDQLDAIKVKSKSHVEAMESIITEWLNGNYNTEMFGPPTWKMLVEAVGAPTGGNNKALAKKIAEAHPKTGRISLLCVGSPKSGWNSYWWLSSKC